MDKDTDPGRADRLAAVVAFADNVLEHGRDRFGPVPTPLLVDGVNVDTRQPVEWAAGGQHWIPSNLASQQNLFRTLAGLSALTGASRYRAAAEASVRYQFQHLRRRCGLLQWGGHRFVDLRTGRIVGEQDHHEFKASYPFYEFLWEVDPVATRTLIRALWNGHVLDWRVLDLNRHGVYDRPMGALWDNEFIGGTPFFEGDGLTFLNCGSDLIYAAALLHAMQDEPGALLWAERLAGQYVRARDPVTGLGVYQYSQVRRRQTPVNDRDTLSIFGDRAHRQFGPEYGDRALEGKILNPGRARLMYGTAMIAQLRAAERLGPAGRQLLDWGHSGLLAFARHAYDPERNMVRSMFIDGTPLTPESVVRPGYYTPDTLVPLPAPPVLFLSFVLGWRLTGDDELWRTVRAIGRAHGIGDLGERPGQDVQLPAEIACADATILFGLLELCRAMGHADHIRLARTVADNILAAHFHHGFFVPSPDHQNARFDAIEPLALLAFEAFLRGEPDRVAVYPAGRGYIHGPHDGVGRTYDHRVIWDQRRARTATAGTRSMADHAGGAE